jgi:hypothetical protein
VRRSNAAATLKTIMRAHSYIPIGEHGPAQLPGKSHLADLVVLSEDPWEDPAE